MRRIHFLKDFNGQPDYSFITDTLWMVPASLWYLDANKSDTHYEESRGLTYGVGAVDEEMLLLEDFTQSVFDLCNKAIQEGYAGVRLNRLYEGRFSVLLVPKTICPKVWEKMENIDPEEDFQDVPF